LVSLQAHAIVSRSYVRILREKARSGALEIGVLVDYLERLDAHSAALERHAATLAGTPRESFDVPDVSTEDTLLNESFADRALG
jgi:hypothetical protein